jgi:hypothetical protein
MRKGEIAKLEWTGFDRETWTLTLPGRITKNRRPRRLALEGPLRVIIAMTRTPREVCTVPREAFDAVAHPAEGADLRPVPL